MPKYTLPGWTCARGLKEGGRDKTLTANRPAGRNFISLQKITVNWYTKCVIFNSFPKLHRQADTHMHVCTHTHMPVCTPPPTHSLSPSVFVTVSLSLSRSLAHFIHSLSVSPQCLVRENVLWSQTESSKHRWKSDIGFSAGVPLDQRENFLWPLLMW